MKKINHTSIPQPSKILSDIYWLENISYDKSKSTINKILSAIDFEYLKNHVSQKFDDLKNLYKELNEFFETASSKNSIQ
jgi:hypothetical protein